jgi:transcriptional regulator with XRE-family HTH domain
MHGTLGIRPVQPAIPNFILSVFRSLRRWIAPGRRKATTCDGNHRVSRRSNVRSTTSDGGRTNANDDISAYPLQLSSSPNTCEFSRRGMGRNPNDISLLRILCADDGVVTSTRTIFRERLGPARRCMTRTQRVDEQAVDKIIGRNLRAFRRQRNMSQGHIADAVKLTFQKIQKYENGSNRISGSRTAQFCQLFKVAPNDFFNGVPGINQTAGALDASSSRARKALRSRRRYPRSKAETTTASSSS